MTLIIRRIFTVPDNLLVADRIGGAFSVEAKQRGIGTNLQIVFEGLKIGMVGQKVHQTDPHGGGVTRLYRWVSPQWIRQNPHAVGGHTVVWIRCLQFGLAISLISIETFNSYNVNDKIKRFVLVFGQN